MQKSKLIRNLYRMSRKELSEFSRSLISAQLSQKREVLTLFNYLKKYYPDENSKKLNHINIYYKIYAQQEPLSPEKSEIIKQRIGKLMNILVRALEFFLIQSELEQNPDERENLLLKAQIRRGNEHDANLILGRLLETKKKIAHKSGADYLDLYHLQSQWFTNLNTYKFRSEEKSVTEIMQHLDWFYLDAKLKLIGEMLNRQKTLSIEYHIPFKNETLKMAREMEKTTFFPPLGINLRMIELFEKDLSIDDFRTLRMYLIEQLAYLSKEEQLESVQRLINYAILAYHKGDVRFLHEQFELYKIALDRDLIIQNQTISDTTFTNIVVLAALANEFDWAENFIENYRALLPEKVGFDAYELAMAYYNFHRGDFDEVIRRLRNVKKFLPSYGIRIRGLLLRTYFEVFLLDPTFSDTLQDYFVSFKKYIREHKNLSNARKKAYYNLIEMVELFMENKVAGTTRIGKEALRANLEGKESIIAKKWLLKKLDEF